MEKNSNFLELADRLTLQETAQKNSNLNGCDGHEIDFKEKQRLQKINNQIHHDCLYSDKSASSLRERLEHLIIECENAGYDMDSVREFLNTDITTSNRTNDKPVTGELF